MRDPATGAHEPVLTIPPGIDCRGPAPYVVDKSPVLYTMMLRWVDVQAQMAGLQAAR